jgi:LysM repeat protein
LERIARQFGVTVDDLKRWNGLRSSRITAGDVLQIGTGSAAPAAAVKATAGTAPATGDQEYRVQRGDNLDKIARRYGVTIEDLKRWNGLSGNRIIVGDTLLIQGGAVASSAEAQRYRIRRGDTLDKIAQRFGVTITDLKRWNGLSDSEIIAGEYLMISTAGSGG